MRGGLGALWGTPGRVCGEDAASLRSFIQIPSKVHCFRTQPPKDTPDTERTSECKVHAGHAYSLVVSAVARTDAATAGRTQNECAVSPLLHRGPVEGETEEWVCQDREHEAQKTAMLQRTALRTGRT